MALNGCLQIITIIAVAFLGLYLLQNMSNKNTSHHRMPSMMRGGYIEGLDGSISDEELNKEFKKLDDEFNGNVEDVEDVENFGGYEVNPSAYDVSPNQGLSSSLNMPKQCGCQGTCDCRYVPPQAPVSCDSGPYPSSPSCPTQVVDQCGSYSDQQDFAQASCFPKSQLSPDELLPNDECNVWSKSNPYGSGSLADRNFLQAGWATGISTVGSTIRNANLQLRSEVPNPQVNVSPWLTSTIQPDIGRKPLEVGGCA